MTDEHWIEINGRRWRATDPAIPEPLRKELVSELMAARRAVKAATREDEHAAVTAARDRVQDAKVALGERGERWWEEPSPEGLRDRLTAAIRTLARHRAPDRTICPSDAARAVGGTRWREGMDIAREAARDLARAGVVVIEQRRRRIDPGSPWRGPIRIRLAGRHPDDLTGD